MTNYIPSIDPANNGTLAGSVLFAFQKLMQNVQGMLPAQVIDYDRLLNRVSVQIMISLVTTDGTIIPRPQIASLPVFVIGGGGYTLSFPLNTGDLGWIQANDRDISLFLQSYNQSAPNTERIKNFADSVFIPDVMRSYNVTNNSANNKYVLLQSTSGKSSIMMGINPTSGLNEINLVADVINLIPNSVSGYVNVYGNLAVTGTVGNTVGAFTPTPSPPSPVTPNPPG